jgi:hypothetical protein
LSHGRYLRRAGNWAPSFAILIQRAVETAFRLEGGFVAPLPFFEEEKEVDHRVELFQFMNLDAVASPALIYITNSCCLTSRRGLLAGQCAQPVGRSRGARSPFTRMAIGMDLGAVRKRKLITFSRQWAAQAPVLDGRPGFRDAMQAQGHLQMVARLAAFGAQPANHE